MAHTMLTGMLLMALAFWAYAIAVALARVRNIILQRERHTEWVRHALEQRG
jgi:heme exporter protein C